MKKTLYLTWIILAGLNLMILTSQPASAAGFEPERSGCCGDGWPKGPNGSCYEPPAGDPVNCTGANALAWPACSRPCNRFYASHTGSHSRACHRCSNVANYECADGDITGIASRVLSMNVPNVPRSYIQKASVSEDMILAARDFADQNQLVRLGDPVELTGGAITSKSSVESFALGDYSLYPHVHPITDYVHEIGTPLLFQNAGGTNWKPVISQVVDKDANVIRAEIAAEGVYSIFGAQFEMVDELRLGNAKIEPSTLQKGEGAVVTVEVGTPTPSIRIRIYNNKSDALVRDETIDTSHLAGRSESRLPITLNISKDTLSPGDYRGIVTAQKANGNEIRRFFVFKVMGDVTGDDSSPSESNPQQPPIAFGDVYVYPNPAKGGQGPTISIEVEQPDKLMLRVYDSSGRMAYETQVTSPEKAVANKQIYRVSIDGNKFKSGIYYGVVTAQRSGQEAVRKKFSFTIVK